MLLESAEELRQKGVFAMNSYLRTKKNGKCYYCLLKWQEGGKQRSKEISTEIPVKGSNKRRAQEVCEELRQKYERLYESSGLNVADTLFTDYIEGCHPHQ